MPTRIEKEVARRVAGVPCPKEDAAPEVQAVPLPPALRETHLTVAAALEVRRILDDETHPAYEGRAMPTTEAVVIKAYPNGERSMITVGTLPPGVRLDAWPAAPSSQAPQDSPEVAQLREELRKSMPEFAGVLEILDKLRPLRDLAGRLAAAQPAKVTIKRS